MAVQVLPFKLPRSGYLLSAKNASVLSDLSQFVGSLESHQQNGAIDTVMVLRQALEPNLDHQAWHSELCDEIWLDDLLRRAQLFRRLVQRIRCCKVPTLFVIEADCFGPYWDLALACDFRICFNSKARIGFPEISDESFPMGGSIEHLYRNDPKGVGRLDAWQRTPVLPVSQALDLGIVHHLLPTTDGDSVLQQWLAPGFFDFSKPANAPANVPIEPDHVALPSYIFDDLQSRLHRRYGVITDLPSAWKSCTALLEERIKGVGPPEQGALICYLVARYMLSPAYLQKLARKFSSKTEPVSPERPHFNAVQIDLGYEVPPARLLTNFCRAGVEVVFFSDDFDALRSRLEVAYARMERQLGSREASRLWQDWVSQYLGAGFHDRIPRWEFSFDDSLKVQCGDTSIEYFRLQGNQGRSDIGWLELVGGSAAVDSGAGLRRLVEAMHQGVIDLDEPLPHRFPLTLLVRSLILEEILAIAAVNPDGLDGVVDALKTMGWGFCGDEVRWERCLMVRQRYDVNLREDLLRRGIMLKNDVWHIGPWKEARYAMPKARSPEKWPSVPLVYVAQHLALYLAQLVDMIVDDWRLMKHRSKADLAVAEISGFPAAWGSPCQFLQSWGRERAEVFAAHHWRKQRKEHQAEEK